eukprot:RCo010260
MASATAAVPAKGSAATSEARIAELQQFTQRWSALAEMLRWEISVLQNGTVRPEDLAVMDLDCDEISFVYKEPRRKSDPPSGPVVTTAAAMAASTQPEPGTPS